MAYYLIDYENVSAAGLDMVDQLSQDDTVCIFYSKHSDSLTFELYLQLQNSQAEIILEKVETGGKNALDFQLSSYLGYLICEHQKDQYLIITKDKGFQSLAEFWSGRGISVRLADDIKSGMPDSREELFKGVHARISDTDVARKVTEILLCNNSKQQVHTALAREYKDGAKGLYAAVKPLIRECS